MTWLIFWKLHTLDLKTFNNNSIRTYIITTDVEFTRKKLLAEKHMSKLNVISNIYQKKVQSAKQSTRILINLFSKWNVIRNNLSLRKI